MLYVETPVGVGFSYAIDSSSYVAVDDEATGNSSNSAPSFAAEAVAKLLPISFSHWDKKANVSPEYGYQITDTTVFCPLVLLPIHSKRIFCALGALGFGYLICKCIWTF